MLSYSRFSPFPEKLHKKEKPDNIRLPPTFDLEFYEYNSLTFIMKNQGRLFADGGFNERSSHPPQK